MAEPMLEESEWSDRHFRVWGFRAQDLGFRYAATGMLELRV